ADLVVLARDLRRVSHRALLRRPAAGERDLHIMEVHVLDESRVHAVQDDAREYLAGVVVADQIDVGQRYGLHHRRTNVAEADVAHHAGRLRRTAGALGAQADGDRSGYTLHHQIRKRDVLKPGLAVTTHLHRATISLTDQTIGDHDIFRMTSAEAEHAP